MDSAQQHQSVLETLRTVEFRLGLKGYNVDEVDEYLEKAAIEAESVLEQLRAASERLTRANDRIGQLELELQRGPGERPAPAEALRAEATVADDALQRTLLMAQRFVEQAKRESEAEAAEVVQRAEERARAMVEQAEERARQLSAEAEQRLREEVGRLEQLRTRLGAEVEGMARHLEEERTRIRSSLSDLLTWIDERVQPASALLGAPAQAPGPEPAPPRASSAGERRAAEAPPKSPPGPERPAGGPAPRLRSLSGAGPVEELFDARRRPE